jgi:hypothetical protein
VRFIALHRARQCLPANLPPEPMSCAAASASRGLHVCCSRIVSPSAVCTPAGDDVRIRSPHCPSLARFRPCTLRAAINRMPRAISGGGSSFGTAASCISVSSGNPSVRCREGMGDIARLGSRAAATGVIHRAEPCSKAPPGQFTPGTDEQCSGRRLTSRRVCCARFLSPSAVCTPANDDTRTQPPRCPGLASIRPCTLRAAINCMPRDISGGGSSFGTAASCTCRVVG